MLDQLLIVYTRVAEHECKREQIRHEVCGSIARAIHEERSEK